MEGIIWNIPSTSDKIEKDKLSTWYMEDYMDDYWNITNMEDYMDGYWNITYMGDYMEDYWYMRYSREDDLYARYILCYV